MSERKEYHGQPYRLTAGLGKNRWKVYGKDDEGQERYLGCIVLRDNHYFVIDVPTPGLIAQAFPTEEEAVEALYKKCMAVGYLIKEHHNYLKRKKSSSED